MSTTERPKTRGLVLDATRSNAPAGTWFAFSEALFASVPTFSAHAIGNGPAGRGARRGAIFAAVGEDPSIERVIFERDGETCRRECYAVRSIEHTDHKFRFFGGESERPRVAALAAAGFDVFVRGPWIFLVPT